MSILGRGPIRPFDGGSYEKAYELVDPFLRAAPLYEAFKIEDIINSAELTDDLRKCISFVLPELSRILKSDLEFVESEYPERQTWLRRRLTAAGRKAKELGGHRHYQEFLEYKNENVTHKITQQFIAGRDIKSSGNARSDFSQADISKKDVPPVNHLTSKETKKISTTVIKIWIGVASALITALLIWLVTKL